MKVAVRMSAEMGPPESTMPEDLELQITTSSSVMAARIDALERFAQLTSYVPAQLEEQN